MILKLGIKLKLKQNIYYIHLSQSPGPLIIYSFVCQIVLGDISTTLDITDCFLCSDISVVSD